MLPGDEYHDRRPIPKLAGEDEKEKRNDPEEEEEGENPNLWKLN